MSRREPAWDELRTFLEVARDGSLSGAARRLGLTQPTVSAGFRARNPGIAIELALTDRNQDLARGDADIAVRMIRPTQSGLVARRIGATRIRLYAHRDYLARFGEPRSLADLANHCFIGFDRDGQTF